MKVYQVTSIANNSYADEYDEYLGFDFEKFIEVAQDAKSSVQDGYKLECRIYDIPDDTDIEDENELTDAMCDCQGYDLLDSYEKKNVSITINDELFEEEESVECTLYKNVNEVKGGWVLYTGEEFITESTLKEENGYDAAIMKTKNADEIAKVVKEAIESKSMWQSAKWEDEKIIYKEYPRFTDIGSFIKTLRALTGMSQNEIAKYLEMPAGTLRNWEQGIRVCPDYLVKLMISKLKNDKII